MDRKYAHLTTEDRDSYIRIGRTIRLRESKQNANVITSLVQDDLHAPCLDIDLPCRLLESTTPGHFHLYIDHLMPWKQYKELLEALVKAGLIQEQWYKLAKQDGFSTLRFADEKRPLDSILEDLDVMIDKGKI